MVCRNVHLKCFFLVNGLKGLTDVCVTVSFQLNTCYPWYLPGFILWGGLQHYRVIRGLQSIPVSRLLSVFAVHKLGIAYLLVTWFEKISDSQSKKCLEWLNDKSNQINTMRAKRLERCSMGQVAESSMTSSVLSSVYSQIISLSLQSSRNSLIRTWLKSVFSS